MDASFSPKRKLLTIVLCSFSLFIIFSFSFLHSHVPSSDGAAFSLTIPPSYRIPTATIKPEDAKVTLAAKLTPSAGSVGFSEFPDRFPRIFSYIRDLFDGQNFFKSAESGVPQGGVAPNENNCNGHYTLKNPLNKNFGDPKCEFASNIAKATDDLKSLLNKLDSEHATSWFQMIERESSYNPNAWASPATGTPNQGGAWGLLQMGQGIQSYRPYDKGDVYWVNQINNAITDIKTRKYNSCDYWQAAKDLGYCFTVQ